MSAEPVQSSFGGPRGQAESRVKAVSDSPSDADELGYGPYVRALSDLLSDPKLSTPLTVGVYGA